MLLDPFEEQLDLPAASVQLGNGQCRQGEVVGQKHKAPVVVLVEEADPSKLFRIVLPGIEILVVIIWSHCIPVDLSTGRE